MGKHRLQLFWIVLKSRIDGQNGHTAILVNVTGAKLEFGLFVKIRVDRFSRFSEDASGDGFVDTKRAGKTKAITVKSISIDQGWLENNNLHVDIVKMDTEGSELLILQGGRNFFSKVKPKVLIEINEKNIKHYPYTSSDLFKEIESLGFVLYRLNGEPLNLKNWDEISVKEDTLLMK